MSHALVLGASGISGWSIVNQALIYPTPSTFSRITGTTNRPLLIDEARIPKDARVKLVSGIDFTKSIEEVSRLLKEKVHDIHTVTHVFFTAYIPKGDFQTLKEVNTSLLDVAIRAIEQVAPQLRTVILQTGGKGYGLEFPKEVAINAPLKETHPRIPEPWASNIFYYTQYDLLERLSRGKTWTFSEIRPDGIVGFAPGSNAMNMGQGIGIYLSIYHAVHGAGAQVPFPGYEHGYHSSHSDTFQDILSKLEIFAALNTEKCGGGRVFNAADGKTVTWADVWPRLADCFGLVGVKPLDEENKTTMEAFVFENRDSWLSLAQKYGLRSEVLDETNWKHVHFMLVQFDFDRQYDLTHSREVGFHEEIDTVDGYIKAWTRMREAKILPPIFKSITE